MFLGYALLADRAVALDTGRLTSRVVSASKVSTGTIVGRTRCGADLWMIDNARRLVHFDPSARAMTVHAVTGLAAADRPWGLACDPSRALWTLATPRVLARITTRGQVVERRELDTPWLALFSGGDGIVFELAPPVASAPLLSTASWARPQHGKPWPGLVGRDSASRTDMLVQNVVICAPSAGRTVPCWITGDTTIVLSDGQARTRRAFDWLRGPPFDARAPLHDAVFSPSGRAWLLGVLSQAQAGRRGAGRIILASSGGLPMAYLDLEDPARLLLEAGDTSCLMLLVNGDLLEVTFR